jgi:hypothetical protein
MPRQKKSPFASLLRTPDAPVTTFAPPSRCIMNAVRTNIVGCSVRFRILGTVCRRAACTACLACTGVPLFDPGS